MSRRNCGFRKQSAVDEILQGRFDLKSNFFKNNRFEDNTENDIGLEHSEVTRSYCSESFASDDSGFNSDSENVDCVTEKIDHNLHHEIINGNYNCGDDELTNDGNCDYSGTDAIKIINQRLKDEQIIEEHCYCGHTESKDGNTMNVHMYKNKSHGLELASDRLSDCSENDTLSLSLHRLRNRSVNLISAVDLSSDSQSDHFHLNRNDHLYKISNKNDISTRNQVTRRRERPDSEVCLNLRQSQRANCTIQDLNNNDASTRNLNSFIKKTPVRLQDFFRGHGLLLLVACIIYTLILVIFFSILYFLMDSLKPVIGTENLKKIRKHIVHSRCQRMSMVTG